MNLIELFKRIKPYVYPYRWLVIVTLILTLIGSLMAQVNAIVLDRTVDAINALINPEGFAPAFCFHPYFTAKDIQSVHLSFLGFISCVPT